MKYIIYKLNDEYTDVVVEETSNDRDWETFRKALINAKSKDKRGNEGVGPRYAVYDFEYELPGGEGTRCVVFQFDRLFLWEHCSRSTQKQDHVHCMVARQRGSSGKRFAQRIHMQTHMRIQPVDAVGVYQNAESVTAQDGLRLVQGRLENGLERRRRRGASQRRE